MGRKKVNSTYRREFSPVRSASQPSAISNIGANYHYREYRRKLEHCHNRTPFVWEDWEYEQLDSDCDENFNDNYVQMPEEPRYVPHAKTQHEIVKESAIPKPVKNPVVSVVAAESDSDECNCMPTNHPVRGHKILRHQGQPPRVLSDTISKKLKTVSGRQRLMSTPSKNARRSTSPFAQYGIGDDERETGKKRTYNILSNQGVYPTALIAKKRQEAVTELCGSNRLFMGRPCKTTFFDPHFDREMNRRTNKWATEYRKSY